MRKGEIRVLTKATLTSSCSKAFGVVTILSNSCNWKYGQVLINLMEIKKIDIRHQVFQLYNYINCLSIATVLKIIQMFKPNKYLLFPKRNPAKKINITEHFEEAKVKAVLLEDK